MPHRALEFNDATYDSIVLPFKKNSLFFPTRSVQQWIIVKSLRLRAASSLNGNKRVKKWKWKENHVRKWCRFFTLPCWHFTTMAAVEKAQNLFGSTLLELLRSKSVWGRAISRKFSRSLDMPTCADLSFFFKTAILIVDFHTCFTTCFDVVEKITWGGENLGGYSWLGASREAQHTKPERWAFFEAAHGKN